VALVHGTGDTGADDLPAAAAVLTAALEPRPGGRIRRAARVTGAVVAQLALQLLPSPALYDVVVRRRAGGEEVLRIDAGDPLQAGDMLAHVRTRLEELDEPAFLAEWQPRTAP
jgi:hypothetical protein